MHSVAIKHIIFDLNGTLADTKRAYIETRNRFISRLSAMTGIDEEVLFAELRAFLATNSLHPDIAPNLPSVMRWLNEETSIVSFKEKSRLLDDEITKLRQHIVMAYRLNSHTRDMIMGLKKRGMVLSVWSGSREPYVIDMLLLLKLDGVVDRVFCPAQIHGVSTSLDDLRLESSQLIRLEEGLKKPSAETLVSIVNISQVDEEDTLLVGNSIASDGMSTVGTKVKFVLVQAPNLSEDETNIADRITGKESIRKSNYDASNACVDIYRSITSVDMLGSCL